MKKALPIPHSWPSSLKYYKHKLWLACLLVVCALAPHQLLAQAFIYEGFVILNSKNVENIYYDLSPSTNTGNPDFTTFLGTFTTDEQFFLRGAEGKIQKSGGCDVTGLRIQYLVYTPGNRPNVGICNVKMPLVENLGTAGSATYQKWYENRGVVDLVEGRAPGSYVLEVYLEADYQGCGTGITYYSNSGRNFVAQFTITEGSKQVVPYVSCPLRPLPVSLTSFDAERQEGNTLLSWETASELHSRGYEVQVSTDGRTFRALGFVPSQSEGSKVSRRRYTYVDTEFGKSGVRYYRLRQFDLDGTEAMYGPEVVSFGKPNALAALTAAPNPFTNEVTLTLPAQEGTRSGTIAVTDMQGRTVFNQPLQLNAGTSQVQLPELSSLSKGLYHLRLSLNGEHQSVKLVKE